MVKGSVVKGELKLQTAKDFLRQKYPGKTEEELKAALDDWFENGGENAVVTLVNPENNTISVDNANSLFTSGTLGGLIHFATDTGAGENGINAGTVMKGLNTLAQTIADVFNDLNTRDGAYCIDSKNTGHLLDATIDPTLIFVGADGTTAGKVTAGNIQVNSELFADNGCWKLSCAYFKDDDNFDINAVGNSQNVVSMLGTRNSQLTDSDGNLLYDKDGNLLLNGMSIEDYYTSIVGKVATAGSNIKSLYNTQNEVVESIKNKIDSQTGVDLNEELVDLVKYQTAYAAAAQVFNACNSCLNTLMALGG